jgi:hypothetical protein
MPVAFQPRVRAPAHLFGTPAVELATVPDVASASALWLRLTMRSPPLFSGLVPDILQVDHDRWSLRAVGLVGAGSAERFCLRLHRLGQDCTLASWWSALRRGPQRGDLGLQRRDARFERLHLLARAARDLHGGVEIPGLGQFQPAHYALGLGAGHRLHFRAQPREQRKGAARHSGEVIEALACGHGGSC